MIVTRFLRSSRAFRASFILLTFDSALTANGAYTAERDSVVLDVEAAESTRPFILW